MRLERKSPQVVFILKYFLNMNVKLSGVGVCVVSTKLEEEISKFIAISMFKIKGLDLNFIAI